VFGEGFAGIRDLKVGPDGYLNVVSLGQGNIQNSAREMLGVSILHHD
jgi:hypothetical protein